MDSRNATGSNQDKRAKGKSGSKHEQLPKDGSDGHCHTCKKNFRHIPDAVRHVKEVHKAKHPTIQPTIFDKTYRNSS